MHEIAMGSRVDLLGGTSDPWMEAMVETHLDETSAGTLTLDQTIYLRGRHTGRLLHEHVCARPQCLLGESRELIVHGSHDDDLGTRREQLLESRTGYRPMLLAEAPRGLLVDVITSEELVIWRQRRGPLRSDQPAADDRYAHRAHAYSLA
jgi:hypothetical protein